ncbi:MAG: family 1 glycosylhydrolase [Lentisphaeria bacterium]
MYDIFSLPDFSFPKGFLWGSATAGHQIEGDNVNSQNWRDEQAGKCQEPSGKACNHYALFREDVKRIALLGHQAYRFSLEWSRIEPQEGTWNQAALDHYKELLALLKAKGVKTYVTLSHFTLPLWFDELGGFNKRENIRYFLRYAEKVARFLGADVDAWLVVNEKTQIQTGAEGEGFNYIRAHAQCYHLLKSISKAPVSSAHMAVQPYPYRYYDKLDRAMTALRDFQINGSWLHAIRTGELIAPNINAEDCPEAKGAIDFWAINIYTRELCDSRKKSLAAPRFPHKKLRMIDMDFYLEEMYPEGTTAMLERFNDKPVVITENGCSCDDDRFRIVYLSLYLSAIHDAIQRGVDVSGYLYWSLMDNYEWSSFKPRFGLVHVDFKTFKRTPKPSASFFKELIDANGFRQDILRKYLTTMPSLGLNEASDLPK